MYKKLDKILFDFIWKHESRYLKKDILWNAKKSGGQGVLNTSFKVKWLTNVLKTDKTLSGMSFLNSFLI